MEQPAINVACVCSMSGLVDAQQVLRRSYFTTALNLHSHFVDQDARKSLTQIIWQWCTHRIRARTYNMNGFRCGANCTSEIMEQFCLIDDIVFELWLLLAGTATKINKFPVAVGSKSSRNRNPNNACPAAVHHSDAEHFGSRVGEQRINLPEMIFVICFFFFHLSKFKLIRWYPFTVQYEIITFLSRTSVILAQHEQLKWKNDSDNWFTNLICSRMISIEGINICWIIECNGRWTNILWHGTRKKCVHNVEWIYSLFNWTWIYQHSQYTLSPSLNTSRDQLTIANDWHQERYYHSFFNMPEKIFHAIGKLLVYTVH